MTRFDDRRPRATAHRQVRAVLADRDVQPHVEPAAGFADRVLAALDAAPSTPGVSIPMRRGPRPVRLAAAAALLLAAGWAAFALSRPAAAPAAPPVERVAALVAELPAGPALGYPERALAAEWSALTDDAAAAWRAFRARLPR